MGQRYCLFFYTFILYELVILVIVNRFLTAFLWYWPIFNLLNKKNSYKKSDRKKKCVQTVHFGYVNRNKPHVRNGKR